MEPPSPQCVGREFVRQYYTLLNQAPLHLHRFYSHNSSFVHGGLDNQGKEAEAVYGQQEIHQKIMQLNFRDCHAKIRQVDSHETLANGVVVQVSGELSNNGEPMRRFMQTFVLAPQSPKKYYVHNDIFRYQDEVFSEADDTVSTTGGNVSTTSGQGDETDPALLKEQIIAAQQMVDTSPIKPVAELKADPVPMSTGPPQHLNGSSGGYEPVEQQIQMQPQQQMEVEQEQIAPPMDDWKEPEVVASEPVLIATFQQPAVATSPPVAEPVVEPAAAVWKSPEPDTTEAAAEEMETVVADTATPSESGEAEAAPATSAPESNAPRTWSSMVKQGGGAAPAGGKPPLAPQASLPLSTGSGGRPESKEGTPFSQGGAPVKHGGQYRGNRGTSQGRSVSGSVNTPTARPERFSKEEETGGGPGVRGPPGGPPRDRMLSTSDSQQLFVGNLPHDCTEQHLEELFGKYGKVIDVRINQKAGRADAAGRGGGKTQGFVPNFGFIVFESTEAVVRALNDKPIMLYGNHRLNVEEKKMRREGPGGAPFSGGERSIDRKSVV